VEVAQYLVSKGASVDAQDAFGITPLLAAVYEGHKGMVEFLLSKGANKNVKGPDGMTPAEAANDDEIRDLLQ
jgi:ankyrin repeat protein